MNDIDTLYSSRARIAHAWVFTGTFSMVVNGPHVTDDFGNSVHTDHSLLGYYLKQDHDALGSRQQRIFAQRF